MMIRSITELIEQPSRDCIYDILCHLNLDLCVDIGAAAGHVTRKICLIGGVNTRVIAFEPFPGNHRYFYQSIKNLNNNITLIKKAVSGNIGTAEFIVPSVVQGSEPTWEKYVGYSSVGFLSSIQKVDKPRFKIQKYLKSKIRSIFSTDSKQNHHQLLKVNTTTIDFEFPNEEIDFMKIDVQGAEALVLRGAASKLLAGSIHILYIEWTGEREVVELLVKSGYQIYDSTYIVGPRIHNTQPFEEIGFKCIDEINLSTGKIAYEMILSNSNVSPAKAISEVKNRELGWIQTDLIAVSQNVKEEFLMATKKYSDEQAIKATRIQAI